MSWLDFTIAALVAFRLTRLVGWDEITQGWRSKLSGMSDRQYAQLAKAVEDALHVGFDPWQEEDESGTRINMPVSPRRYYAAKLLHCPWCVGFWISGLVTLALSAHDHPGWLRGLGVWFAVSAIVGLVAKNLDP